MGAIPDLTAKARNIQKPKGQPRPCSLAAYSRETRRKGGLTLVTSDPAPGELTGLIDILLPMLPWLEEAVTRAQLDRIGLGFAKVPVITPEDLVVAKCYALGGSPDRFQDLDDLKEIFGGPVQSFTSTTPYLYLH